MNFLPDTDWSKWGFVNLQSYYASWAGRAEPRRDADMHQRMIADLHEERNIDCSYGGWLEVRDTLLAHTYLADSGKYLHLGVDFNVPAGSRVAAPRSWDVVLVDDDHPDPHGWGPRVVFCGYDVVRTERIYVIFAHLDADLSSRVKPGATIREGYCFAAVGAPPRNGGWFPHLHVQVVTEAAWNKYGIENIDGYGHPGDAAALAREFPDPLPLLIS